MVVAVAMAAATAMNAGMVPSSPPSSLPSSPEKDEEGAAGPLDGMSLKALLAHAEECGVEADRLEAADGKAVRFECPDGTKSGAWHTRLRCGCTAERWR